MKSLKTLFTKTAKVLLPVLMFVSAISANTSVVMAEEGEYAGKTIILHTNDVHGAIDKYKYVAGVKKDFASKGAEVILVDAGDYSQGQVYVSESKGATAVELMEDVGYDYVTLGNHEFDYGQDAAFGNLVDSEFKVICANVEKAGGDLAFDGHDVKEIGGMKIGFFGLETPEAQTKVNPALIKGLKIYAEDEMYDAAKAEVKALNDAGADLVIALVHLGDDASSEPNTSYDLAAKVSGIDMIIDGHAHSELTEGPNGEAIVSTGTALANIGVIVIDNATKKIEKNYLMPVGEDTPADADVAAAAQKIIDEIEDKLGQKFATSEVTLNGAKAPNGNRDSETNNGDLITDAMMYTIMKDTSGLSVDPANVVAITNGGGIRAAVNPGDVSMKDIKTVLPFGNTVAVVYVSGAELLEALEASTYCTPESVGAFPQIAGMKITLDTTKAYDANEELYPGSTYYGPKTINRVTIDEINGKAFDPAAKYAVITNNFCAAGGDTYYAFASAKEQFDTGIPLDEAVVDYIENELKGVISKDYENPQGRITILKGSDATAKLYGTVTDAGQVVDKMEITFAGEVTGVDETTFTVNAKASAEGMKKTLRDAGLDDTDYGSYNITRKIVKAEVDGNKVTLTFRQDEGSTLSYFAAARNYPVDLEYTVTSNKGFSVGGEKVAAGKVDVDVTVNDAETAKFTSVKDKINYQYHEGTADTLIVWFHGNGEGDLMNSGNNVAQMLANRGTVAWVTDEANKVFGDAYVMAFQAPDTWYYAQRDGLLAQAKAEIDAVVAKNGIKKIIVSGCSAGGYMTTRMILAYPDLFDAAMINCPALDVASARGGETPTDEELASLIDSRTPIWLVQGVNDASVDTELCSKRIWAAVTKDSATGSKRYDKDIASGFDTYETPDGKYKLTLYDTTTDDRTTAKLKFAEDYDQDGTLEEVQYSNHWSWIYTLRNDPEAMNGDHIWQWAASQAPADTFKADVTNLHIVGDDWGPSVDKVVLTLEKAISAADLAKATITVTEIKEATDWAGNPMAATIATADRAVTKVYLSDAEGNETDAATGTIVTAELYVSPNDGSPFRYVLGSGFNKWCDPYTVTAVIGNKFERFVANTTIDLTDDKNWISEAAEKFDVTKTYTATDGTVYQYGEYIPAEDDKQNALVIWLHGAGEGQNVNKIDGFTNDVYVDLLGNEVTALVSDEFQNLFEGAYVLVPQSPTMWMDDGTGAYQQEGNSCYGDSLFEMIDEYVKANPDIDPKGVIVGGCSNGGYMTMELVVDHPGYFQKAYPICEALDDSAISDAQIKAIAESRTGIWFTFADSDPTVNPKATSIPTITRLKKAGADVHYTSYPEVTDTTGRFTNADGTPYTYNGHWSWIYFDNNSNVKCNDHGTENEWVWLATPTPDEVKVTVKDTTYNGTYQKPASVTVTVDGVTTTDYTIVSLPTAKDAGVYQVSVRVAGRLYKANWIIHKADQVIRLTSPKKAFKSYTKTYKYKTVKKSSKSFTLKFAGNQTTVRKISGSAALSYNTKTQKVTVKKGTKKGTYQLRLNAPETKNYGGSNAITIYVKVK